MAPRSRAVVPGAPWRRRTLHRAVRGAQRLTRAGQCKRARRGYGRVREVSVGVPTGRLASALEASEQDTCGHPRTLLAASTVLPSWWCRFDPGRPLRSVWTSTRACRDLRRAEPHRGGSSRHAAWLLRERRFARAGARQRGAQRRTGRTTERRERSLRCGACRPRRPARRRVDVLEVLRGGGGPTETRTEQVQVATWTWKSIDAGAGLRSSTILLNVS